MDAILYIWNDRPKERVANRGRGTLLLHANTIMGRIAVEATIENGTDATFRIRCDALVDTGAAYLTLPNVWRDRLGTLTTLDTVAVETATQAVVSGDICGQVLLRMEHFRPVLTEVLFTEMDPADGQYEPLIGYIPLEQAQAVVDLADIVWSR